MSGSNINNSGNYNLLSLSTETNTNNNNNSLLASNAINDLEDTLDDVFGVNVIEDINTNINTNINIPGNNSNTNGNTNRNIPVNMDNIIPPTNILSTNSASTNNMNNTLSNNNNSDKYNLYEFGTPLSEFDNSNKNANTNMNKNLLNAPNRTINTPSIVNNNVKFADPINNLDNVSDNINTNLSNNKNNKNNVNTILKDGLLETSSNNSTVENYLEDYYYLDDNKNANINSNINSNTNSNTNLKNINISNTNANANGIKISDNFILEFPARMADGRQFTDYKSNGFMNLHEQELKNTLEYRLYLQNNAENIMDNNYNIIASINECSDCPGYQIVDTKSLLTCSKESCVEELKNKSGIGYDIQYVVA